MEYSYLTDPQKILKVLYNAMNVDFSCNSPALELLNCRIKESIRVATILNENNKPEFKLMERAKQLLDEPIIIPEPNDTLICESNIFKRRVMRYEIEDLLATM
jgi:hypothetical protein